MVPLLILASISSMLWIAPESATGASSQMVQDAANGEFLWKYYPPGALKRGEQGRVGFWLTIEPTGAISKCSVRESSGFSELDKETCEIMTLYAHVKPPRNSDGQAVRAQQAGFITWKLPDNATRIASVSTKTTMPKPDDIICRTDTKTGLLVATTKQCMTRTEWVRTERMWQDEMYRIQAQGHSCGGGGTCPGDFEANMHNGNTPGSPQ